MISDTSSMPTSRCGRACGGCVVAFAAGNEHVSTGVAAQLQVGLAHNDGVKHATDAVPSSPRRPRVLMGALAVVGVLLLSACATPAGAPTPSASGEPSPTSSASPTALESGTPSPTPTDDAATDAPFNGQILIVTSEVRDGNLEVTAMVPGVSESGGKCTLTLEASKASVSVDASEGKDVTYCGLMSIPVDASSSAPTFVVGYASNTVKAQSAVTTVEPTP